MSGPKSIILTCEHCHHSFARSLSYHRHIVSKRGINRTFCSRPCRDQAQRIHIPPEAVQDYAGGLSLKELSRKYGSSAEHIRRFLLAHGATLRSRGAHLWTEKNPTRGKGHTEATKVKLRAANLKQFSDPANRALAAHNQRRAMIDGKVSCVSGLEDAVAVVLNELEIEYRRQAGIRDPSTGRYCACVDFALDEQTVIEVNGAYWHADPRLYPTARFIPRSAVAWQATPRNWPR